MMSNMIPPVHQRAIVSHAASRSLAGSCPVERSDQQQSRARFDKTASSWRRKLEGVQNKPMTGEWSQYYRQAALHDLEVLHARFIEHRFARHSHEYYVIGVVEAGVQASPYRGMRPLPPAGHVFLVNPGEPHTGEAATPGGYIYRTVYPRLALVVDVTAETTVRARSEEHTAE